MNIAQSDIKHGTESPAPQINSLSNHEARFIGNLLAAHPQYPVIESTRQATGIRDVSLALARAKTLLASEGVLAVLVPLLGVEQVVKLFQSISEDPPNLNRYQAASFLSAEGGEIADLETRKRFWSSLMNDEGANPSDRLRASDLLAKSEGDYKDFDASGNESNYVSLLEHLDRKEEERRARLRQGEALRSTTDHEHPEDAPVPEEVNA